MRKPDVGEFLRLVEAHRSPTLSCRHRDLHGARPSCARERRPVVAAMSLVGAAPIAPARLEEALKRIGPMGQLFGQTEAPMMIATLAPKDHFSPDGTVDRARLASAGRPSPLVRVAILGDDDKFRKSGERGEIVVRGSLCMKGYYKNPERPLRRRSRDGGAPATSAISTRMATSISSTAPRT